MNWSRCSLCSSVPLSLAIAWGQLRGDKIERPPPSLADLEAMRKSGITPIIRKMIDDDDGTSTPAAERRERNRPSTAFARSPDLAPLMTPKVTAARRASSERRATISDSYGRFELRHERLRAICRSTLSSIDYKTPPRGHIATARFQTALEDVRRLRYH